VKTISLKKVSAVAVASLGFGLLSVVPAQATVTAATSFIHSGTGATTAANFASSATVAVGTSATTALTAGFTAGTTDAVTLTAVLTTSPGTTNGVAVNAIGAAGGATFTTVGSVTNGAASGANDVRTITATGAGAVLTVQTLAYTPTVPGIYSITVTVGGAAGTVLASGSLTHVFTIYAGYDAGGTTNVKRAYPITGSNITTGWAATSAGQAKVRITGFADATTYYYTTDTGAIVSGVRSASTAGTVTNTNGTNLGGGFYHLTASPTASDFIDVTLADTGSPASTTLKVVSYNALTGAATTFVTATVTWGVAATPSAQYSLLTLNAGTGTTATGAAADTTATIASRSLSSGTAVEKFRIQVVVNDQYNVAYTGATLAASVTGPASLGINGTANSGDVVGGTSVSEAMTGSSVGSISVFNSGVAGTAVITITATTAAGVATTLGSKTVKFAGSASKAVISQNLFIAKAGTQLGLTPSTTNTTGNWSTTATTPAFQVSLTDSTGIAPMSGATVKMTSSDATVIVVGTCAELTTVGSPAATNPVAAGTFDCSVSGATGAASGKSATVTFTVLNTTTALYDALGSTPITFTIGGAIDKCVIGTDKASYDPGAGVNLTATCTDSSGNKPYDGQTPYAGISSNKSFGGALPTTSAEINSGKTSTTGSTGVAGLYAPSVVGPVTISGKAAITTAAPTGTAFSVALTVNDGNAGLLTQIDALNAKIVALNALIAKIMKKLGVK
jgi:hypothetical protein